LNIPGRKKKKTTLRTRERRIHPDNKKMHPGPREKNNQRSSLVREGRSKEGGQEIRLGGGGAGPKSKIFGGMGTASEEKQKK